MAEDERNINASYHFKSRLKGMVTVELFNNSYLNVEEKPLKSSRQFQLETVLLDSKAKKVEHLQLQWLVAAVIAALSGGFFIYALLTGEAALMSLLGLCITLALSALFVALYFYTSERKWILQTRHAHFPLLEIPYTKRQQAEAEQFIETIKQTITSRLEKKGYSSDDLFAGELRMLRRFREGGILDPTHYEQAKAYMMQRHGKEGAE